MIRIAIIFMFLWKASLNINCIKREGEITTPADILGGAENDQHPIATGTIDGDKVVITATHATNGREYRSKLTLQNEELTGTVTAGEQRAQVRAKRRKENPK